jgi:hypothetical protein
LFCDQFSQDVHPLGVGRVLTERAARESRLFIAKIKFPEDCGDFSERALTASCRKMLRRVVKEPGQAMARASGARPRQRSVGVCSVHKYTTLASLSDRVADARGDLAGLSVS